MEFCMNEVCIMQRDNLPAHIRAIAAHGIRHMEIRKAGLLSYLRSGGTLEEVKAVLEETGMAVDCINALEAVTFQDARGAQELRELAEFLFYCCRYLGCPNIELIAAFGAPTGDAAEIKAETVRALRELSDLARPYGVNLALEYMGLAGSSVVTFLQTLEIVRAVISDLAEHGPSEEELERVREQAKANLLMGTESIQARMSQLGTSTLLYGRVREPDEILAAYDAVTREQLRDLAAELFQMDRASLSAVGRVGSAASYAQWLGR